MAYKIFITNTGLELRPYHQQINKTAQAAIKRIGKLLPLPNFDLVIYKSRSDSIPEIGIGGRAKHKSLIFVSLNPEFRNFKHTLRIHLPRTIAHELHHLVRYTHIPPSHTLLNDLVTEGLADHFELEVFSGKVNPWDRALPGASYQKLLSRAKKILNKNYGWSGYSEWFYGSKQIPRWSGYRLGYELTKQYLKNHPETKPSKLYKTPAKKIAQGLI